MPETLNSGDSSSTDPNNLPQTDTNQSAEQNSDANNSAGSSEAGTKTTVTMSDVVKDVLKKDGGDSSTPKLGEPGSKEGVAKKEEIAKPEGDESLPFHKHPRFQQVISENQNFKREIQTLEPLAQEMRSINDFVAKAGLAPQEVAQGYQVMAWMKQDPIKAYEALSGYLGKLGELVGETLPKDLQDQVDSGDMSADAAKVVARARFQTMHAQTQTQAQLQRSQEEQQARESQIAQEQAQAEQARMNSAVSAWETQIKTSDPDYDRKEEFLLSEVRAISAMKPPKTAADIVANCQEAYDNVTKRLKGLFPARKPMSPIPSGQSSVNATQVPGSISEIVKMGMNGQLPNAN